jgi:hypothetical protein
MLHSDARVYSGGLPVCHGEVMEPGELDGTAATPEQLAAAIEQYGDALESLSRPHEHAAESVREATYKGHHIRIVTTYRIEVDGVPITGHLLVTNGGTVHYHAIPNQEFPSAVDMVKRIIDLSPEGFPPADEGHGDHPHHGGG